MSRTQRRDCSELGRAFQSGHARQEGRWRRTSQRPNGSTTDRAHLEDTVLIRGGGRVGMGGVGTRKATTPGGRGGILMLTEGDGCDSADSHVPRGVRLVLTFPPGLPSLCQAFALLCPLLSFNIWSLFSISNTRAPAMTSLLKMPTIGKVSWVFLFFFFLFQGLREPAFTARACLRVRFFFLFFVHVYMFSSCGFAPVVLHITANQIQQSCS